MTTNRDVQVRCPENASPGTMIVVTVEGTPLQVTVPEGVKPNQIFTVSVPVFHSATAIPTNNTINKYEVQQPPNTTVTTIVSGAGVSNQSREGPIEKTPVLVWVSVVNIALTNVFGWAAVGVVAAQTLANQTVVAGSLGGVAWLTSIVSISCLAASATSSRRRRISAGNLVCRIIGFIFFGLAIGWGFYLIIYGAVLDLYTPPGHIVAVIAWSWISWILLLLDEIVSRKDTLCGARAVLGPLPYYQTQMQVKTETTTTTSGGQVQPPVYAHAQTVQQAQGIHVKKPVF